MDTLSFFVFLLRSSLLSSAFSSCPPSRLLKLRSTANERFALSPGSHYKSSNSSDCRHSEDSGTHLNRIARAQYSAALGNEQFKTQQRNQNHFYSKSMYEYTYGQRRSRSGKRRVKPKVYIVQPQSRQHTRARTIHVSNTMMILSFVFRLCFRLHVCRNG